MGTVPTTTLEAIREGAERGGYAVEGFAPSSKAAGQLRNAGIEAATLQSFLARRKETGPASRHLYLLDESSLASTRQMRAFLEKIGPDDRVLVVGDTRQHQAVDAGRPFQQMQEAGMRTSRVDTIIRQKDPELLRAVEHLAANETVKGVALLAEQGRVTELRSAPERIAAIARDYAEAPENTIIVSPDNRSRQQINEAVRKELLEDGTLATDGRTFQTLAHRSDLTGPDRTWAAAYRAGDVVQYGRGSKLEGIAQDSFGVVQAADGATNRLTVKLEDGSTIAYNPKRVYGINVYREVSREFSTGDRLQFSAQHKQLGIANRDLGTITGIAPDRLTVRLDGKDGRSVSFDPAEFRQFDHGYAVTSHSSQGLTVGRVLANIDTEGARSLINTRLAYVAVSRAEQDARIYTNNAATLGDRLATEVTKTAAVDFTAGSVHQEEGTKVVAPQAPKQNTVHEYANLDSRLAAVALAYAAQPERSIVVAPDRGERDELTQLIRSELYAGGKLGREAHAYFILVEKDGSSRRRAESYQPGDKIQFQTGSPRLEGIPHNSEATVLRTEPGRNLITIRTDAEHEETTYNPAQLRQQTKESRLYRVEVREIAEGERIRFTRENKALGVRAGELGTVMRLGGDGSLGVKLDSGKTAELTGEQAWHIDYGYTVQSAKAARAERVLATADELGSKALDGVSPRAEVLHYTGSPALTPAQVPIQIQVQAREEKRSPRPQIAPEVSPLVQQQQSRPQQDFGIGSSSSDYYGGNIMALHETTARIRSLVRIGALFAMPALSLLTSASALAAPNSKAVREALIADYPLTRVGNSGLQTDYNRITQPGAILAVRVPGIYADEANTDHTVVGTNITNGQVSQASGFFAAAASTNHSRTLARTKRST